MKVINAARALRALAPYALMVAGVLALCSPLMAQQHAAGAAARDPRFEPVRALIERTIREDGVASVAVSVAQRGQFIWEEGFGWADRERRIAATAHTPYSTASISKPVTATAIMILAERGSLDIERPANAYLAPGGLMRVYEGRAEDATVRRVLSHTAGLPLHYQFFYEDGGYAPPAADVSIHRYAAIVHPPGARYVYSNIGYGVLDRIIERVSGRSYGDFLLREVFVPLGMHRSSVGIRRGLEPYTAARYGTRQERLPFYEFDHPGGSAVYASAHDLVRFGLFHMGTPLADQRAILRPETRTAMQRIETPPGSPRGYGLGWIVTEDYGGYRQVAHSGGMPGVSTQLQLYPDAQLAIAVVTNSSGGRAARIADAIAAALLPDFRRPEPQQPQEPPPLQPPAALIGTWVGRVGTYAGETPLRLHVRADGAVHVRLGDGLETLVNRSRLENGIFRGEFLGTMPTPDAQRHPHTMQLELALARDTLRGSVSAVSTTDPIHFALSAHVALVREAARN
jgi:CubicO group peptidase (beta-lactamase class C family)